MLKRKDRSPEFDTPLERSMQILERASREVRAISHGLGTSTLRELGLAAAIEELLEHLESEGTTRFEFATYGLEERLPEPVETGLFRVAQELITNVLRHAGADEATVQILEENREVRLTVEDNGAGFDLGAPRAGMGLGNITARVAAMGGRVHYDSMPGHGTSVTVVVGLA
jgi:signal transduction histidine kinase